MAKLAALAAALVLYSPSALAWGGLGHEAICELAFLELDDTARQRVIALISTPDFLQSSNRIGPDLHRVHCEGYVEERVFERERVRRRQAKVESPVSQSRGVPSAGLVQHHLRVIDPADEGGSARQSLGQPGTGAASDLEDACAGLDAKKINDPAVGVAVRAGHHPSAEPAQQATWSPESTHQKTAGNSC